MTQRHRMLLLWPLLTLSVDLVALIAAGNLAYLIRYLPWFMDLVPSPNMEIGDHRFYIISSIIAALFWTLYMAIRGSYRQRWWEAISAELGQTWSAFLQGYALLFALIFFYRGFSYSRVVAVLTFVLAILFLTAGRTLMFQLRRYVFRTTSPHRMLILGMFIPEFRKRLGNVPQTGLQIITWLEDDGTDQVFDTVERAVKQNDIDTILLTYSFDKFHRARRIIDTFESEHMEFLFAPDPTGVVTGAMHSFSLGGVPLLQLRADPLAGWNGLVKRTFDVVFSLVILILVSPLLLFLTLLVLITSRGSAIYRQKRVGLNGELFTIYKFRSMRVDAEKESGPVWATANDTRTTPIGRFLRRWSLDELPQLWNVLIGDMSLVGPRPERPNFVEEFKEKIPRYSYRHQFRCGLTGWAQVNGLRGQAPIEERTKYDLYYVENWSLGLDLKILFMTLTAVLTGRDAY